MLIMMDSKNEMRMVVTYVQLLEIVMVTMLVMISVLHLVRESESYYFSLVTSTHLHLLMASLK